MNQNANAATNGSHSAVEGRSSISNGADTGYKKQMFADLGPVRLSAFQKELEEAVNEPIFIQNIKAQDLDESESDSQQTEDENLKPKVSTDVVSKPVFAFLTPNSNKIEHKAKFTQSLTQVNESTKTTVSTLNLQTPINKSFRTPCMTQEKSDKSTLQTTAEGFKSLSMQDAAPTIKKSLNFNHFLTPTISRLPNFNTPRMAITNGQKALSSVTSTRTPSGQHTFPKSTLLAAEKKYLEAANEQKRSRKDSKEKTENKENVSNNKIQWSGQISTGATLLQLFDKITVGKVEYIILNQLGKGGSSVVYHCYDPVGKQERAIKKVTLMGDRLCVEGYINEVKMLHKLQNCDRIIKMYSYEIIKEEKVLYMVLEKGERDLSSILKDIANNTKHLPIYMLIYYWMEMLFAVKQIHENGIIHSDLKPANFLVAPSGLKLIDFGIASSMQADVTHVVKSVQIGSFNYISPEALRNNSQESGTSEFKISFKSDVWSLGCILYQLVYRRTPFQHIGHTFAKLSAIQDPEQKINYPDADWVPPNIIATIKACLQYNMRSRPSIDELIKEYENIYY